MPVPKSCSHNLFTIVLDTSGFLLSVSHIARPSLFFGALAGIAKLNELGTAGSTSFPKVNLLPLSKTFVLRHIHEGFSIITGVVGTSAFTKFQNIFLLTS